MAEEKGLGKFLVYCGLLLILFLVMVEVIFSFGGRLIKAEILILLFLMFLALIGFVGYKKEWGERVLFFVFLIGLANLVFIWYFTGKLFMLPLFLGLIGFLMSLPRKEEDFEEEAGKEEKKEVEGEPYSEVLEEEKPTETAVVKEAEFKEEKKKTRAKHTPGKYVASKMSNVYHEPKCEWAKRIAGARRVWFKDKKEARSKRYKKHSCVK